MDSSGKWVLAIVVILVVIWVMLAVLRLAVIPIDDAHEGEPLHERLSIGFLESVDSLNPYVGLSGASHFFRSLAYDCLTTLDEDMSATPNLVKGGDDISEGVWALPAEYDNDPKLDGMPYGSVWQYNLTQNAKWTDGESFSADDVLYTFDLNAAPSHYDSMWAYQPYSYYMHEAWKLDEWTVRMSFWDRATLEPIPASYAYLISIPMLPKHLMEQLPGGFSYIGMNWTGVFPDDLSPGMPIVGTGPWIPSTTVNSDWIAGDQITLLRNPNYHWKYDKPGAPEIRIDELVMKFYQDTTSMVLAIRNGEIDVAAFPPIAYDSIKDDVASGSMKEVTCFSGLSCAQGYVFLSCWMNTSGGDNDARLDPDLRKALAMAIDKSYIVNNIYLGYAEPGTTLIPPVNSFWHYEPNSTEMIPYDVTAANALLNSSGYIDTDGNGIRDCTVTSTAVQMGWVAEGTDLQFVVPVFESGYPSTYDVAKFLKSEWGKIGVGATLQVLEYDYWQPLCPVQEDISVSLLRSLDPDPEYVLFTQSDAALNGWSDTGYSNSSYNESYAKSVSSMDTGMRKAYVDACQRILYDECPQIVLAYPYSNYVWRTDDIEGWGDWAADPGRSLDACWGGNPLFFDLGFVSYTPSPETESNTSSLVLNGIIMIAVIGTVVVVYFLWSRLPRTENPPKP